MAAMTIGRVQPGTRRGTFWQIMGSRKITPPRIFADRAVSAISHLLQLEFLHAASSGVMVAHLTPTPCLLIALAAQL